MKVVLFIFLFSAISQAQESKYRSYCIESLSAFIQDKSPIVFEDATIKQWTMTWDGKSLYRESDLKLLGAQIETSKQEIWNLNKFKDSGDGATRTGAPSLQIKNAQRYLIMKMLFKVSRESITEKNAKRLDKALASCDGVTETVALDGELMSKGKWESAGDSARNQRTRIRNNFPALFKNDTTSRNGSSTR